MLLICIFLSPVAFGYRPHKLHIPLDYERSILPPSEHEGERKGVRVQLSVNVVSFGPVDTVNELISAEIYLRSFWNDPRLKGISDTSTFFGSFSFPHTCKILHVIIFCSHCSIVIKIDTGTN